MVRLHCVIPPVSSSLVEKDLVSFVCKLNALLPRTSYVTIQNNGLQFLHGQNQNYEFFACNVALTEFLSPIKIALLCSLNLYFNACNVCPDKKKFAVFTANFIHYSCGKILTKLVFRLFQSRDNGFHGFMSSFDVEMILNFCDLF